MTQSLANRPGTAYHQYPTGALAPEGSPGVHLRAFLRRLLQVLTDLREEQVGPRTTHKATARAGTGT